jgi:hypothetical protein
MTGTQLNNEFRPYYTTSGNYMFWHDYAVIKFNYLFESLNKIGLVKRLDAQLRLWINTGTVNVTVANPDATTCSHAFTPANNTFFEHMPYTYQSSCWWHWCRYSTRKYCSNSSWSLYRSPSYNIVCWYQFSSIYCTTFITKLPFILFSSNCRSSKIN